MITEREFERTLTYVRRTDVHTRLEEQLRPTLIGRPRRLRVDVLLAGLMLGADKYQSCALTVVHRLLTTDLPHHTQVRYGILIQHSRVTLRQIRYLVAAIADLFEHTKAARPTMDEVERVRRQEALESVLDALTGSASRYLDPTIRYAIDGSAIESAARGRRSNQSQDLNQNGEGERLRCADVDARWGYRTKTYDNKTNLMFGYQLIAHTRIGEVGQVGVPLLTEKIRVVPGNAKGITESLDLLRAAAAGDNPIVEVTADRGVTYAAVRDWAAPLAELGIAQVLDMHDGDRGPRPHLRDGYVMIDGWPHVASIPDHLTRIGRPARMTVGPARVNATRAELAERKARVDEVARFNALIAERTLYRFERVGKTSAGNYRYTSPARAGKMRCAGYPDSLYLPDDVPACVHPVGQTIPVSCRQVTITVPAGVGAKLRQDLYWGSPEWIRSYSQRTRVEGSFGVLKSTKNGGIRRGWTHQVGLVKTTLLLALAVAASNLRQLLIWAKRTGDTRDPLTTMDVTNHGFVELDAEGNIAGGVSPPQVA